jgi:hypothetical protein
MVRNGPGVAMVRSSVVLVGMNQNESWLGIILIWYGVGMTDSVLMGNF